MPRYSLSRHPDTTLRNSRSIIFPTVLDASCFLSTAIFANVTFARAHRRKGSRRGSVSQSSPVEKSNFRKAADLLAYSGADGVVPPRGVCLQRIHSVASEDEIEGSEGDGGGRKIVGFLGGGSAEEKPDRERRGAAQGQPVDDGTHLRDGAMAICLFYFSGPDPASL